MPLLNVTCPEDGEPLEVSLELRAHGFDLRTSPAFVEHQNTVHGAHMTPVDVWPPVAS